MPDDSGIDGKISDQAFAQIVVEKILLLTVAVPRIKQKFEIMASVYPYYLADQEVQWIAELRGRQLDPREIIDLRRRMVRRVRSQIRAVQSNLSRPLLEIEAAARPVDALLSREKMQGNWLAKLGSYVPMTLQGVFAVGLFAANPANPLAWNLLAGFLGTGVIRQISAAIAKDSERVNQISRAALTILPWWQVFMRTFTVNLYETSMFIDEDNTAAMKRDRALVDKVPADRRNETITRLAGALRRQIVKERRNRFQEVFEGSRIRTAHVVSGIEALITVDLEHDIDAFIRRLDPHGDRHTRIGALPA
jgi:hypothetical protein